ncbi:MAG: fibronectin type III domain-containing protein [Bacteroidota bacterium]
MRYEHKYLTNQYLAISEFRVFGKGKGALLKTPANFTAQRDTDRRNAFLNWDKVADAMGYVVYWGIQPDRLNLSAMVYGENAYEIRALNTDQPYYFRVEAFSEHGISAGSSVLSVE